MDNPLGVSVIIPAYNAEHFVSRAIDSVLAQTYLDVELILVDNNSTDGTQTVLRKYEKSASSRPIRVVNCPTQGCSAARNYGVSLATKPWLQFLDADDTLAPEKISQQLTACPSDAEWIIGGYRNLLPDGSHFDNLPHEDPWKGLVYRYRIGYTCSNLYRRSALKKIGGWRETLPDNTDPYLHFDLLRAGTAYHFVPEPLSFYHHDSDQRVSTGRPVGGNLRRIELLRQVNEYLAAKQPDYWAEHKAFFLGALLRAIRILATHDLDQANALYQELILAAEPPFTTGRYELVPGPFLQAYRYLGFHTTERLRLGAARWVPGTLKRAMKGSA